MSEEHKFARPLAIVGGSETIGDGWLPWSDVWALIPGFQEYGFMWHILGEIDPSFIAAGYYLKEDQGVFTVEKCDWRLDFERIWLKYTVPFFCKLAEMLSAGTIQTRGSEGSPSSPTKHISARDWRYWKPGAALPFLSQDIVVFEDIKWFHVEVRLIASPLENHRFEQPEHSISDEPKRLGGRPPGKASNTEAARLIAERMFSEGKKPDEPNKSQFAMKIMKELLDVSKLKISKSSLLSQIDGWFAAWQAK